MFWCFVNCDSCGLVDCGRKFLTLLPEIGSGDEDSEEFEVCEGVRM